MKHTHHIIPKYMGGTDDPSNLIELTIEEHAEAHRLLYEQYGNWQDKVAWQGLLGLMSHEQIMEEMYGARRGEGNNFYGKKHTDETKKKISENRKGKGAGLKQSDEWIEKRKQTGENHYAFGKIPWNKGKVLGPQSAESRRKKGKPLIYNGVEYNSLKEAEKITGVSYYKINKACQFL